MLPNVVERAKNAYDYPLLIKQLLHTPLATAPDQEIVYRDLGAPHLSRDARTASASWPAASPSLASSPATPWR